MQEHQYRWALDNRRRYAVRPLFAGQGESGRILRETARQLRQTQRAESSVRALLDNDLAGAIRFASLVDDTLVLEVDDAVAAENIRRQCQTLTRNLSRQLGGFARLRITGPTNA
jgi:hypothetical protein